MRYLKCIRLSGKADTRTEQNKECSLKQKTAQKGGFLLLTTPHFGCIDNSVVL